jgi:hypothetical protein
MLASRNHSLVAGGHQLELRQAPLITSLFLDLEDAESVRSWVDDPGSPGEADVGDAVLGLEPRGVVVCSVAASEPMPRRCPKNAVFVYVAQFPARRGT